MGGLTCGGRWGRPTKPRPSGRLESSLTILRLPCGASLNPAQIALRSSVKPRRRLTRPSNPPPTKAVREDLADASPDLPERRDQGAWRQGADDLQPHHPHRRRRAGDGYAASTRSVTASAMRSVKLGSNTKSPSRWAAGHLATARKAPRRRRHMDEAIGWIRSQLPWHGFPIPASTLSIFGLSRLR